MAARGSRARSHRRRSGPERRARRMRGGKRDRAPRRATRRTARRHRAGIAGRLMDDSRPLDSRAPTDVARADGSDELHWGLPLVLFVLTVVSTFFIATTTYVDSP